MWTRSKMDQWLTNPNYMSINLFKMTWGQSEWIQKDQRIIVWSTHKGSVRERTSTRLHRQWRSSHCGKESPHLSLFNSSHVISKNIFILRWFWCTAGTHSGVRQTDTWTRDLWQEWDMSSSRLPSGPVFDLYSNIMDSWVRIFFCAPLSALFSHRKCLT